MGISIAIQKNEKNNISFGGVDATFGKYFGPIVENRAHLKSI